LIGGWLATKIGGKLVFGFAILSGSIVVIISPFAARWSYIALIACRFLAGFLNGPAYASMANNWVNWAPRK
jgi:MFS family permease